MMKFKTLSAFAACLAATACASATPQPKGLAAAACGQLGDTTQAMQSVYGQDRVYAAGKVNKQVFLARAIQPTRTVGADLYVRGEPGMNEAYVERVLTCHAANRAMAHPNDPLVPQDGTVTEVSVRRARAGLAVRVIGDSATTGEEIWNRAQAFAAPTGSVRVKQVASRQAAPDKL